MVLAWLKKRMWSLMLSSLILISIVSTTFYTIGSPRSFIFDNQICLYEKSHYEQNKFDIHFARELISQIPDDAYVSAATMFVPHLALRHHIEDFESNKDTGAEYVLITKPYFDIAKNGVPIFGNRDDFDTVTTDGTLYLLRKKQP